MDFYRFKLSAYEGVIFQEKKVKRRKHVFLYQRGVGGGGGFFDRVRWLTFSPARLPRLFNERRDQGLAHPDLILPLFPRKTYCFTRY